MDPWSKYVLVGLSVLIANLTCCWCVAYGGQMHRGVPEVSGLMVLVFRQVLPLVLVILFSGLVEPPPRVRLQSWASGSRKVSTVHHTHDWWAFRGDAALSATSG